VTITAIINENDLVITHWKAQGTHQGNFKNINPSQKPVKYNGLTLFRIKNEKIIEYWAYLDMHHLITLISLW
jgi:predicted ester cyclase